jgi:putative ribosome biogenesis GTPase RsgA
MKKIFHSFQELDDWADLCMPSCVHDHEPFDSHNYTFQNPSHALLSSNSQSQNTQQINHQFEETNKFSSLFHWQAILG